MKSSLKGALDAVNMSYDQLKEIAEKIAVEMTGEMDKLVNQAINVKDLTDSQIRNLILLISLKCYSLAEAKEYSLLKLTTAIAEHKNSYAEAYQKSEGTVGDKNNQATSETVYETMSEAVYQTVASLMKTKVDEAHRITDALKCCLTSRMAEAKLIAAEKSTRAAYD